jgi:mannose-6-phosphate isomerase class I
MQNADVAHRFWDLDRSSDEHKPQAVMSSSESLVEQRARKRTQAAISVLQPIQNVDFAAELSRR